VLEYERSLLVAVTLDARSVSTDRELALLLFKSAVRIMAVTAVHRAFEHLMTKRFAELGPGLGVTRHAKLRLVRSQHRSRCLTGFVRRYVVNKRAGSNTHLVMLRSVRRVALRASDVIAPVFSATEVVVIFLAGVALQARLGGSLRIQLLEGNYLCLIARSLDVCFAGSVARLATDDLTFPGGDRVELAVLCAVKALELLLVTSGAGLAADVVIVSRDRSIRRRLDRSASPF
jgi:hypothetical protein